MPRSILSDAFAHHTWATLRLLDACAQLSEDQLATRVPGTYGSIIETMRHTVDGDAGYLIAITGDNTFDVEIMTMSVPELRQAAEGHGRAWEQVIAPDLDPDTELDRRWDDGSETHTTVGVRLAQALHHGTDHRSQVCTALTALGIEPPDIDVWAYADRVGRLVELQPGERPRGLSL